MIGSHALSKKCVDNETKGNRAAGAGSLRSEIVRAELWRESKHKQSFVLIETGL